MTVRMARDMQNGRKPASIGVDPPGMRRQRPTVKVRVKKTGQIDHGPLSIPQWTRAGP